MRKRPRVAGWRVAVRVGDRVHLVAHWVIPSGKRLHNYGKSPFSMGNSTISMVIFNSYVKLPEGNPSDLHGISRVHPLKKLG